MKRFLAIFFTLLFVSGAAAENVSMRLEGSLKLNASSSGITIIDTFTGAAGPLSGHSPDTGPSNFYAASGANWTLDGVGNLINTPAATNRWTSDFSMGVDGVSASNGAVAGDVDFIGGQNNNLRFTANAVNGTHAAAKATMFTVDKFYRIRFSYYIPSGQSNIDGIAGWGGTNITGTLSTTDAWTAVDIYWLATSGSSGFSIYGLDGGNLTWQDAGGDDVFYLKNIQIDLFTESELSDRHNMGFSQGYFQQTLASIPAGALVGVDLLWNAAGTDGLRAYINRTTGTGVLRAKIAGVWQAALIDTAITYSAGANLVPLFDGTYVYLFYNNLLVGTRQDISALTTIKNNTWWGNFSTDSSTTISAVTAKPISLASAVTVSGITKANPGVVTAPIHGYANGDLVYFSGLTQMTELNGRYCIVANKAANTFEILNTSSYGAAETTGGLCVRKVQ